MEPTTHMNKLLSGAIKGLPWGRTHSFSARFSAAAFSLIEAMLRFVESQRAAKYIPPALTPSRPQLGASSRCHFKTCPLDGTNGQVTANSQAIVFVIFLFEYTEWVFLLNFFFFSWLFSQFSKSECLFSVTASLSPPGCFGCPVRKAADYYLRYTSVSLASNFYQPVFQAVLTGKMFSLVNMCNH